MRKEFIEVLDLAEAQSLCPWAAVFLMADGGWWAFESVDEARTWERQA